MNYIKQISIVVLFTLLAGCGEKLEAQEENLTSRLDRNIMFTDRDILQSINIEDTQKFNLESNKSHIINKEGIYYLTGNYVDSDIIIDVNDTDKVQLILDELSIINSNKPPIYIKSGDKIFITTTDSYNSLSVTDNFSINSVDNLDAVIFSKSDLVLNGKGTLDITSKHGNGITSKDDLKITGGIINIEALKDGLEANDSIRVYNGNITLNTGADGLHSENKDNLLKGFIYIQNGKLDITTGDDGIRGTSIVQIDGGFIKIRNSQEGIEANQIQINGGNIDVYATDDGINATSKSILDVLIEVYGGNITVKVASGDTDAFDANGDIYIYGGIINVEGRSSFDADRIAELVSGYVTINGERVTELPVSRQGRNARN